MKRTLAPSRKPEGFGTRLTQGAQAELLVAAHMESNGFALLEHSYRTKTGEVDLIMHKGDLVVFVEVKQRTKAWFDHTDLITVSKQNRVASAAYLFINSYTTKPTSYRFDVAIVEGQLGSHTITYIENAFSPDRDL